MHFITSVGLTLVMEIYMITHMVVATTNLAYSQIQTLVLLTGSPISHHAPITLRCCDAIPPHTIIVEYVFLISVQILCETSCYT